MAVVLVEYTSVNYLQGAIINYKHFKIYSLIFWGHVATGFLWKLFYETGIRSSYLGSRLWSAAEIYMLVIIEFLIFSPTQTIMNLDISRICQSLWLAFSMFNHWPWSGTVVAFLDSRARRNVKVCWHSSCNMYKLCCVSHAVSTDRLRWMMICVR